ncbi:MAG: serine hydrolase [Gammaproteobacteria bacterium]|nr:serine hydrolase [Gammaproteobacteria bacterium]MCP5424299.1 serine hydrolase [Gammaproteobacteria bacterium]MCP5459052.1 serine hydrolase [Gammaproteobacteria bacterium]
MHSPFKPADSLSPIDEPAPFAIDASRRRWLMTLASISGLALFSGVSPESKGTVIYRSPRLNNRIELYVKDLRRHGLILRDERTAWSVYDFTTQSKLVSINENIAFQSASMIKPFVALAFFYQLRRRKVHYGPPIRRKMEAMIQRSDNTATNYFLRLLGGRQGPYEVERLLKRNAPGIFRQTRIVEYIPRNGRTYRNKASARDYSRFLYALWYDQLPYSREIKRLMGLPNKNRITHGAPQIPARTPIYDKTGTTSRLCGNMGIVVAIGRNGLAYPYTFIGIIEKSRRAQNLKHWSRDRGNIIRRISNLVYSDLKRIHNLV